MNVLFVCEASPEIGFGHVSRCLTLAKALNRRGGLTIRFAMSSESGVKSVGKNYQVLIHGPLSDEPYVHWLDRMLRETNTELLILDIRQRLTREDLTGLRHSTRTIVTLDDAEEKRLAADLALYPPVPQVNELTWDGMIGNWESDWSYVIVDAMFTPEQGALPGGGSARLLVSMGWSDPRRYTFAALEAMSQLSGEISSTVMIGSGFQYRNELAAMLEACPHEVRLKTDPPDRANLMAAASCGVISFGVTAWELAALGVPALYLCLSEDHARSATCLVEAGVGRSLGIFDPSDVGRLAQELQKMLGNPQHLEQMRQACRDLSIVPGGVALADRILQGMT